MQPVVLPFIVDDKASGPLAAIAVNLEKIANATKGISVRVRNVSKAFDTLGTSVRTASQILNSAQFKKGNLDAYLKVMEATTKQLKAQAQHQKQLNDAQLSAAKQQAIQIRAQASAAATMHKANQAAINQTASLQQKTNQQTADMQKKNAQQVANMQAESAARVQKIQAQTANIQARGAKTGGGGSGSGGGGSAATGAVSATGIVRNIMGAASYGLSIVWKLTKDIVGIAKFLIDIPGKLFAIGSAAVDAVMSVFNNIKKLTSEIIAMSNEFEIFQYSFASMLMASGEFEGVRNQSENIIASLEYANYLYEDMVILAAELPGEAKDFMDAFLLALPSGRRVGLTDPSEFMKLSSNVTAIGISLGHSALRAGNSLNQLLQGTTTKQNALTQKLLTSIGMATVEFNQLKPEERLVKIKEIVEAYGDGIESYKNTFDALYSTMLTNLKEIARLGTKPIFEHSKVILKEVNLLLERFGPQVRGMLWELSMDVLDYVVAIQNFLRPILEDTNYYIAVGLEMSRGFFEEFIRGLLTVLPYIKQLGNAFKEMVFKVMNFLGVKMPKVTVPEVVLGYPKQIEDFIASEFAKHTPAQKAAKGAEKALLTAAYKGAMAIEPFIPKQMEEFGKALGLSGEKVEQFGKELKFEAERKEYEKRFLPVSRPYYTVGGTYDFLKQQEPLGKEKIKPREYGKYDFQKKYTTGIEFGKPLDTSAITTFYSLILEMGIQLSSLPAIIESFYIDLPTGIEVGMAAASQASQQMATASIDTVASFTNLHDAIFGILIGFGTIKAFLLPVFSTIGSVLVSAIGQLGMFFPMFGKVVSMISAASPLTIIIAIIGGFLRFMTYTEQFALFMGELQLAGAELVSALLSFGKIVGIIFEVIGAVFAGLLPGIMSFISSIMSVLNVIMFVIERVIMPVAKPVITFVKFLASIFGALFSLFGAMIKALAWGILDLYNWATTNKTIRGILDGIGYVLKWFDDALGSLAKAIDRYAGWLLGSMDEGLKGAKKEAGIIHDIKAATGLDGSTYQSKVPNWTWMEDSFAKVIDEVQSNFSSGLSSVMQQAVESGNVIPTELIEKLGEIGTPMTLTPQQRESIGLPEDSEWLPRGGDALRYQQEAIKQQQEWLEMSKIAALESLQPHIESMASSYEDAAVQADFIAKFQHDLLARFKDVTVANFAAFDIHAPEAAKKPPEYEGKGLNNYQDFRGSRFSISQKFEEGFDPDRIAVAFTQDLSKIGEKRIQSGLAPLYTIR